jgi:hypothetical protein
LADAEVVNRVAELGVGHGASKMAFEDGSPDSSVDQQGEYGNCENPL